MGDARPRAGDLVLAEVARLGQHRRLEDPTGRRAMAGAPASGPILDDAGPALAQALDTLPSGTLSTAGVRPLSTFRDADGRPCREFETAGRPPVRSGIACREPHGGWDLVAIVALPDAEQGGDGFAPASGPQDRLIDMALESLGAGVPPSPGEEAGLLRSGWGRP